MQFNSKSYILNRLQKIKQKKLKLREKTNLNHDIFTDLETYIENSFFIFSSQKDFIPPQLLKKNIRSLQKRCEMDDFLKMRKTVPFFTFRFFLMLILRMSPYIVKQRKIFIYFCHLLIP